MLSIFIVLTTHFTFDNCTTIIPRLEIYQGELAQLGQVFGNNPTAGRQTGPHLSHLKVLKSLNGNHVTS
jgi:hypothetical protein